MSFSNTPFGPTPMSEVHITGGSIDGTPIGSETPASGVFTTLSVTGLSTGYLPYQGVSGFADSPIHVSGSELLSDSSVNTSGSLQQLATKGYVDLSVTSLGASYYMTDTSSGVSDYRLCSLTPPSGAEDYLEGSSLSDGDYIGGWISASGETPDVLLTGGFNFYIMAKKISGTKTLKLYWKMYERKSDTTETLIATSSLSDEITDSKDIFVVPMLITSDHQPDSGSRIVGKLYASVTGGGSAPTIRVYYEGTTGSRWDIPANSEVFRSIFVPYSDAVKDVDLGSHSMTVNDLTISSLSTGYIPYHTASGLADSPIKVSGNDISVDADANIDPDVFPDLPSDEGLVGYWSFDDGTGTKAVDNSGNGNDGQLVNMEEADWVDGVVGKALDFDGVDEYIDTADINEIKLHDSTFSFWVKVNDLGKDLDIICKGEHADNQPLIIWRDEEVGSSADLGDGNTDTISILTYDGTVQHWIAAPSGTLNDTNWHHFVVVIDVTNNQIKVYKNGDLIASNTKTWDGIESTVTPLRIGDATPSAHPFSGLIDEVRIYNRALTASEIKALYLYPAGNKATKISGNQISGGTPVVDTIRLTNLSNGYIPYHVSDASGLANSPISYESATEICINAQLVVEKSTLWPTARYVRVVTDTTSSVGVSDIVLKTTGDMADGFGPGLTFSIQDDTSGPNYIAGIYTERQGADNTGCLNFKIKNGDDWGVKMSLNKVGNLGLNTTTFGNNAAHVFGIGNGTAPTSSPADMVHMWAEDVSDSSELKARDEAGNTPTLTPHNFSLFEPSEDYYYPWSYYARNPLLGREINVDMYGAISDLEKLTKKKYIYTRDLPPEETESYDDWNRQREEHYLKKVLEKADEIEVPREDALEEVEETVEVEDGHEIETRYQLDGGEVMKVERAKPRVKKVPTGNVAYRLRDGVRFCEKTGRFFRKPTLEEIEYEPYKPKELPAWMLNILKKKEQSTAAQSEGFMRSFVNWAKKWLGVN